MRALTVGASSAVDGAPERISAATSPSGVTDQAITEQATTSAMQGCVQRSRDHSAATLWRSATIAQGTILR